MPKLYNTRTKEIEKFRPLSGSEVGMYTCGPTVYNYAHIGNLRTYIFEDILKRVLRYHGYKVNHVMNITDVGHLTDDADQGMDKMEKGAEREGKTAWEIALFYTEAFLQDMKDLNIQEPQIWCRATEHIPEQVEMVQALINKGFAYETSDGIYFDTTKVDDYGALANLQNQELQAGARTDMREKKHPHDFALWKFTGEGEKRQMEWEAFGKKGFPGWHIECSAMAIKYLGEQFDIHCGGIDHIPVHHTNEIAQSESFTGKKPWVNFWLHGEFLHMCESKMSKSGENFITLQILKDNGVSPLAYRYFLLQAHYRKQVGFSWEALHAAQVGLSRLRERISQIDEKNPVDAHTRQEFYAAIDNDMNMPEALAILQTALKQNKLSITTVMEFDKILGLDLMHHETESFILPEDVSQLLEERAHARETKQWEKSDQLRDQIAELGFLVKDTDSGQKIEKNK